MVPFAVGTTPKYTVFVVVYNEERPYGNSNMQSKSHLLGRQRRTCRLLHAGIDSHAIRISHSSIKMSLLCHRYILDILIFLPILHTRMFSGRFSYLRNYVFAPCISSSIFISHDIVK